MELVDKEQEPKKPYVSPELVVYGDIRTITHANDDLGRNDGGGGGAMDKT